MEYFLLGLLVWGMVSVPFGIFIGRALNRMEQPPHYSVGLDRSDSPMWTYVGPMPRFRSTRIPKEKA